MSLYGYRESLEIAKQDYGFYALIMAAMRKADSRNIEKLKQAWPDTHAELMERYNAPGGFIGGEVEREAKRVQEMPGAV